MKTCCRCLSKLPADREHFDAHASSRDGLEYYCKECRRESQRADYVTWGHRHFPDVQAFLYALAWLKHGRTELLELAERHHTHEDKQWNTDPDGSEWIHWLLSPDCGKACLRWSIAGHP